MAIKAKIQCKSGHKVIELNRRRAIRERCLNCSEWNSAEVDRCEMVDCQLYSFRTGQGKQNAKQRTKAIRAYCAWCMDTEQPSRCAVMDCPLYCYRKSTVEHPKTSLYAGVEGCIAINEW
jgi:hypothetical protein